MYTCADQNHKGLGIVVANCSKSQSNTAVTAKITDNRSETVQARELQAMVNHNPRAGQATQLQAIAEGFAVRHQPPVQKKPGSSVNFLAENKKRLSDELVAGTHALSGHSVRDVEVNLNASKPAAVNAEDTTQSNRIEVASGQEKHIPHEAWPVVQQREINDDPALEKEADVMGAKAGQFKSKFATSMNHSDNSNVIGRSNHMIRETPSQPSSADNRVLQRKLAVLGEQQSSTQSAWERVGVFAPIQELTWGQMLEAKDILHRWIHAPTSAIRENIISENRDYGSWEELARSLAGEINSEGSLVHETWVAGLVQKSQNINNVLGTFLTNLRNWHTRHIHEGIQTRASSYRGRYRIYYGTGRLVYSLNRGITLSQALDNPPGSLNERIAIILDYARFMRRYAEEEHWYELLTLDMDAARSNHWNPNESANWTQEARRRNIPLSAGPSGSTMLAMALGRYILASPRQMEALAWGIFSFFNQGLHLNHSGTHSFHEVMVVAHMYGVPYTQWITPIKPPYNWYS